MRIGNGSSSRTMIVLCSALLRTSTSRTGVAAFSTLSKAAAPTRTSAITQSRTALKASFLEEISRTFSNMAGDNKTGSKYFTIGLTGSGGLVGTAFQNELSQKATINGKPIRTVALSRGKRASANPLEDFVEGATSTTALWNPNASAAEDVIDPVLLSRLDAIVHLCGENVATGEGILAPLGIRPWTESKKKEIMDSRVVTTSALAKAIAASDNRNLDFVVASGVGAYGSDFIGDKGKIAADESADVSKTKGFLAEVSRQWEASADPAAKAGNRVVNMRNGVVLSTKGGVLGKLFPIFFLGGGGIVGGGEQYFPYISGRDVARAMVHILETPSLKGPVNMVAPVGCTNAGFTSAMGKALNRPTLLPFPAFACSLLFGEMGEELLLGGTHAAPKKLMDSGFSFLHPTVDEAVQSAVDEKDI